MGTINSWNNTINDSVSTITVNSGADAINVSSDATNTTVNIATGVGDKTLNAGSANGASITNLYTGSGGINIPSFAEGALVTSMAGKISTVTGTSGYVLTANAAGTAPDFQVHQGGTIVTGFTSPTSGNFTLNARTVSVEVYGWSGGSGGGSGRRGLTGAAGGGGGGIAGSACYFSAPSSFFVSPIPYVVGAGTAGAAAQTSDNTDGLDGSFAGATTSFGNIYAASLTASGAKGGKAGITSLSNQAQVSAWGVPVIVVPSGSGTTTNGISMVNSEAMMVGTGGGGGSGANSVTVRTAGSGGSIIVTCLGRTLIAAAAGGVETGTIDGADGTDGSVLNTMQGGTGGGGGGGQSAGAVAGKGGNGGFPGGGGGGGGGSLNGTNSGAGGDGGDGALYIIEHLS